MSLLDLLYPPTCKACRAQMQKHALFCPDCMQQLQLLPNEGHCTKCFVQIQKLRGTCQSCRDRRSPFKRVGACFDSFGPARKLLQENESRDLAALILMQLENLSFPTFELITTLPSYFSSPFALVARELSRLLHIPSMSTLNRTLSLEPRFTLKKKCNIINKGVLLLHTECQEGEELRSAGWALREGFPETLYALSFCATIY